MPPKILIQFEGLDVSVTSRTYNFLVVDAPGQSRHFRVRVPAELFRATRLQFQDGPPISFEMLQREIDGETPESLARAHLSIAETDIHEYLNRHYPRKDRKRGPAPRPVF
jgi:hypothetical protein